MKAFDEILVQLIIQHDCVVIPEFGGFVSKAISSKIDFDKGTMSPPSKQLLFNVQLINNDGLLNASIASINQLSYLEANEVIRTKVSEFKDDLKTGKKITINKVGTLQYNQEGALIFEQDRFFNFLLASYGLSPIKFIEAKPISTKNKIDRKNNVWKYAAAACLLPIAFYSLWIPLKTNVLSSKRISINDLNPFHQKRKINYVKTPLSISEESAIVLDESIEEQYNHADLTLDYWYYEYDGQKQFAILNENKDVEIINAEGENVNVEDEIVPNTPNQIDIITPFTFNCIAGCFSNYKNAQRFVTKLKGKGYNACILPGGQLYRVSLGGGFSEEAVIKLKKKADQDGIDAWILH
jgi:hypothetical protein